MWSILLAAAMAAQAQTPPLPYNIKIEGVQEVCLIGLADLAYWEKLLETEGLHPTVLEGHAQVLVCTFNARWMGFRFREGVMSVFTSAEKGGTSRDGLFLAQAFNSRPFFAWVERSLNKSPYDAAELSAVSEGGASSMAIGIKGGPLLEAHMVGHTVPDATEYMALEGPLYLPKRLSKDGAGQLFYAKLEGETQIYPFSPERDVLTLRTEAHDSARMLIDSHFTGHRWWIRTAGKHAKSKTISRP